MSGGDVANGLPRGRTALVLYGSETGNAHDLADEMGRMTERLRFSTDVTHLDAVEATAFVSYSIVLLALSTTGQGDLPNNARAFWSKVLRKRLPSTYLDGVRFAAFGLGDSSYPKYNWAIRKLHRRLLQLGASELLPHGEGDEQHPEGSDATFIPWLQEIRELLLAQFPLDKSIEPIPDDCLLPPKWKLALATANGVTNGRPSYSTPPGALSTEHNETSKISQKTGGSLIGNHIGVYLNVRLQRNERLTPTEHWQDVRHLVFSTDQVHTYAPGDILTIYPENTPDDVNHILSLMEWEDIADSPVELTSSQDMQNASTIQPPLTKPITSKDLTLRTLLAHHLDLTAIPRRSFFSLIAHFTTDPFHKDRLLEFTKPEYLDELYDYTTRPRRSVLEVLQEFHTVKIPWQWAATVLPELRGRQFSIASGGSLKSGEDTSTNFELLVAIVKYKTVIKRIRRGVCTRYLAGLAPGAQLRVCLQQGDLGTTAADASRPVVMIGPGTGVAPMRALIWERRALAGRMAALASGSTPTNASPLGDSVLFYGCRNSEADFFFRDEWKDLEQEISLQVFAAFSRDQKSKIYVQDLVKEQAKLVFKLLHEQNGIVYVCGSSGKMPQAVREALVTAFQQAGGMETEAAEAFLARMEKESRYKQETW
ncbi:NAPDH-dependent diflavin reductase [Trapelia coarctata]|nr:NAPDH-dependent diflavin reductase [Trapelia coarctata]